MSILDSNTMDFGQCLAGERFRFVINGMDEGGYLRTKSLYNLKRSVDDVKRRFWCHQNSLDIIKENIGNFPICDKPISVLLQWIEISISREMKSWRQGHTRIRKEDNAVFAWFKTTDRHVRMLSICAIEK